MSFTHTSIGIAAIVAVGTALIQTIAPETKHITVHEITYDAGMVTQSRTVRTDDGGPFFAEWRAEVIDAETGEPVDACSGSGSWNYNAGHADVSMTLSRWTGTECTKHDLPASFSLRATWRWGSDQTSGQSPVYTLEGT